MPDPGAQADAMRGSRGWGRSWGRREAALVFVLALIPRLAHWWQVRATPLAGEYVPDLSAYLYGAARLVEGAYFFVQPMVMSLGYSLALAPAYFLAGPDVPLFVLQNAVLDAGSAALCAGLAARLAGPRAGLIAGALYALCGPLLFYALLPLAEGPAIFCLLLGLNLLFLAPRRGALCAWLAGAFLALAALLRPNLALALLLALAAWSLAPAGPALGRRLRAQVAARCLLGFVLALAPFMAHNAVTVGRASPFGFQGGFTLYTGNHPGASGVGDALPGFDNTPYMVLLQSWRRAESEAGRQLTLAEADAWWYGQSWSFFSGHPGEAAGLLARKALLLLNDKGVDATANQDFCARFSPVPNLLALPVGLVFACAAAGLCLALRRRRGPDGLGLGPESAALAALLLGLAAMLVLFQVTPRYRVLLLPLAMCFAAVAAVELPGLARSSWRGWALPVAALALVLAVSLIPLRLLVHKPRLAALEHARLARYYLLRGPQRLAQEEYRAALALGAPEPQRLRAELAASLLLRGQDTPGRPVP